MKPTKLWYVSKCSTRCRLTKTGLQIEMNKLIRSSKFTRGDDIQPWIENQNLGYGPWQQHVHLPPYWMPVSVAWFLIRTSSETILQPFNLIEKWLFESERFAWVCCNFLADFRNIPDVFFWILRLGPGFQAQTTNTATLVMRSESVHGPG